MSVTSHETATIPLQDPPLETPLSGFAHFDVWVGSLMASDCKPCVERRGAWLGDRVLMLESRSGGDVHRALAMLEELVPCLHGDNEDITLAVNERIGLNRANV